MRRWIEHSPLCTGRAVGSSAEDYEAVLSGLLAHSVVNNAVADDQVRCDQC